MYSTVDCKSLCLASESTRSESARSESSRMPRVSPAAMRTPLGSVVKSVAINVSEVEEVGETGVRIAAEESALAALPNRRPERPDCCCVLTHPTSSSMHRVSDILNHFFFSCIKKRIFA